MSQKFYLIAPAFFIFFFSSFFNLEAKRIYHESESHTSYEKVSFGEFLVSKLKKSIVGKGEEMIVSTMMPTGCPDIEFIDLRNVAGYPQIDDLNICGAADTLSMIIFTGDPGEIKGFEFEIDFPNGIEYAGWEYTQLGETSINASDPDPNRPTFLVDGITGDSLVIVNIGVRANCEVDKSEMLFFDYNFEYVFIDTSNVLHKCSGTITPSEEFNSSVHVAVLNMLSPLDPVETEITELGAPACQTINFSQDGLNSYLDSFRFEILGLELFGGDIILDSIRVNNMIVPSGDIGYDAGSLTTSLLIDDTYFIANGLANPTDGQMNTNETLEVEVCYSADRCPSSADLPFSYLARWGCDEQDCATTSQTSFLKIRPTGSLPLDISSSLNIGGIEICGDPGMVTISVTNPNPDTDQFGYTDVQLGFQTCDKPNLDVTAITLNGVSVPISTYSWIGSNIVIDLTSNTDPTLGLIDHDGDGFFDDIRGGTTISGVIEMSVTCGIDSEGDCANINCEDVQFYVSSATDCGASVKEYPSPDLFTLQFGADTVYNPTEVALNTGGTVFGYDFGTYSNNGAPLNTTDSSAVEVEFCYDFATTNIESCTSGGTDYFVVDFSGDPRFILDMQFVPNSDSLSTDGGTTYTAVNNATLVKPDDESATLTITGGSNDAQVCYKYSITMDSCLCMPVNYFVGRQQVIHECPDCVGGCEIVKACRDVTFKADPNCSDCDCIIRHHHVRTERLNLGYTDKTMTTKHTRESLSAAGGGIDLSRYVPGDTIIHESQFVILQEDALRDVTRWNLQWSLRDIASTATADLINLELLIDAHGSYMNSFMISKVGGARQLVDFNILTNCHTDNIGTYGGVWNTFENGYFDGSSIDYRENHNSSGDLSDNNTLQFNLWNYDKIETCGGNNASHGGDDCLDQLIETYNIEVGDTLHLNWKAPLIKNPHRAALESLGQTFPSNQGRVYPTLDVYANDPIGGDANYCYSLVGGSCREWEPMNFDCPGDIGARTVMDLDDCGGTVTHEFFVNDLPGDVGDPWFTQEYKPFANIIDVDAMIRAPLAYCANAQVEKLGVIYDVAADSMVNMFCNLVTGYDEPVCGVDTFGTIGTMVFDLASQGVPSLGVGLDNCDTIRLSYDLCMVCPGDIPGVNDYNLVYDWAYTNFTPKGDAREHTQYRCNIGATLDNTICDEFGLATNDYYYEILELDTVSYKKDWESDVFLLNDMRDPMAPVTITNEGANLLVSGAPGVSVEIQEVEICNPDTDDATGVGISVTIPSSVRLEDVYTDAGGTMPLMKALISDDGANKVYQITLPSDTYVGSECNTFYVGTTLLFCPEPTDAPPKVCVGVFSGCAPEAVKTALARSEGCASSEICYTYIFGEVELQTEWFDLPTTFPLCDTITMNVLVKNVKELVLLELVPMFDLPPGIAIVPGSWQVAYPGGPTMFGPWTNIPTDPDVVVGNTYSYSDVALWNTYIDGNGLEGVSAANVMADSNKVSFRFRAYSECDEFLSGSKALTETTATDPCSDQVISSGLVQSPPLVIQGAEPINYAQLLLVSDPEVINCEGTVNTFGITAINSGTESTSDSVLICVTFPEGLEYQSGTVAFSSPAGFPVGTVTEMPIGTSTEVCFSGPQIGPYGSLSMTFDAEMDKSQECGDVYLLADIKSFVDSVTCSSGALTECGVFVQSSINNQINVELAPPFVAEDIEVFTSCPNDQGNVELSYEFTINHNGPNASNQPYTVNFYEDVDGSLDVNSNIDNLLGSESGIFSVNDGTTIMLSGAVDVPDGQSCPVLFEVVYDTDCACDRTEEYLDNIKFEGLKEYDEPLTMCPGSCIDIDICDYISVGADSIIGATGVVYAASLDWVAGNCYTFPRDTLNGVKQNGPTSAFIDYTELTNNSSGDPGPLLDRIGNDGLLFAENNSCAGSIGPAHIVASYSQPVAVDSVFVGSGDVEGWGNTISNYSGVSLDLEYSDDGINWMVAHTGFMVPSFNGVEGYALPVQITAQFWRLKRTTTGNWGTSEFRLEGEGVPYEGFSPVTVAGNTATICIPDGAGIDDPWPVTFTTGTGNCLVEETLEIYGIDTPGITLEGDTTACENQCVDMEIIVPNDAVAGMTVSWTPAALIDDPTAFRVEACSLTMNTTFQATVSYNDGACVDVIGWPVQYFPENSIDVQGEEIDCYNMVEPPVLTGDTGWDLYNWYQVLSGTGFIAYSSTENTFIPTPGATYYLQASRAGVMCPAVSESFTIPNNACLLDLGDLPDTGAGTSNVNYETLLANNGPYHIIIDGLHLGPNVDDELDGQPSSDALGDGTDENTTDFPSSLDIQPNSTFRLPLSVVNTTGETAHLEAWIDWNGDGEFTGLNEMILDIDDSASLGVFPTDFTVTVPSDAAINTILGVRFRLSNTNDMTPYGLAEAGEIEDYLIQLDCDPNTCLPVNVIISNGGN